MARPPRGAVGGCALSWSSTRSATAFDVADEPSALTERWMRLARRARPTLGRMPASPGLPNPVGEVAEDYGAVGERHGVVRKEPPEPLRYRRSARLAQGHHYDSAMRWVLKRNGVVEVAVQTSLILEGGERTSKGEDGADVIGAERRIVRENIVDGISTGKRAEHLRHKDARTAHDRSAVAYRRIHFYSVNAVFHIASLAPMFSPVKPKSSVRVAS